MKHLQILLYILITLQTNAQTQIQNGKVREINSDKKPLSNVSIIFEDAIPTTSDDNGDFRLKFSGKKAGDLIFWETIEKAGYEIVNEKALEILKISNDDKLGVDIILAKKGIIDLAKKEFYKVSDKALSAGFVREKVALKKELAQAQITENEYAVQLTTLQEQYDWQWELLDELANKFARVNFDDVSEEYEKALKLFKDGKIEASLQVIQPTNLLSRLEARLEEQKRIENGQVTIANQIEANEAGIRQDIEALQLHAELYTLNYQINEAEEVYDQLLRLDSMDLEVLFQVGDFYSNYHKYIKGISVFEMISLHQNSLDIEKAFANTELGNIHVNIGELDKAKQYHEKAYTIAYDLWTNSSQMNFVQYYYLHCKFRLGELYLKTNNEQKGFTFLLNVHQNLEELDKSNKPNLELTNQLVIVKTVLGQYYYNSGNSDKALEYFLSGNKILEKLYSLDVKNRDIGVQLALSYGFLGNSCIQTFEYNKALVFYSKQKDLLQKLRLDIPNDIRINSSLVVANQEMGLIRLALEQPSKAIFYFNEANKIAEEMTTEYPLNTSFINAKALAIYNLGNAYFLYELYDEALKYYLESKLIYDQLVKKDESFQKSSLLVYDSLGKIYFKTSNYQKALQLYKTHNHYLEKIYVKKTTNLALKQKISKSYHQISSSYKKLNILDSALHACQKANKIAYEIYEELPEFNTLYDLMNSYKHLGEAYYDVEDFDKAMKSFEAYKKYAEINAQNVPTEFAKVEIADAYALITDAYRRKSPDELISLNIVLENYEAETKIMEEIYAMNPYDFSVRLSHAYHRLSWIHSVWGYKSRAIYITKRNHKVVVKRFEEYPVFRNKQDLGNSYFDLANIYMEVENIDSAIIFQLEAINVLKQLCQESDAEFLTRNLGFAYNYTSEMYLKNANYEEAFKYKKLYNRIFHDIYLKDKTNIYKRNNLAISYANLATFYRDIMNDNNNAKLNFIEAKKIWESLTLEFPNNQNYLDSFNKVLFDLSKL